MKRCFTKAHMITMKKRSKFQMMMTSIENIIIYFIIGSSLPLQTTSTPIEISQLVNHNVSLDCPKRSSDNIIWKFNGNTLVYDGTQFKGVYRGRSRFENDSATGKEEVLKISYIKPEDAGLYRCEDPGKGLSELQSTQLTVLGSEPTCASNSKDNEFVGPNNCSLSQDYMNFSCAVSYHGTEAPLLQWEDVKNNQILNDSNCEEKEHQATKWISCTLTLKAEPKYDGSHFRCKVITSREQYNCSTGAIKVLYFILEEHVWNETLKVICGNISCSVKSNLERNISCIEEENSNEVVVGTNHSYVVDKKGRYNCTVSYGIKDVRCSAVVSVVHTGSLSEADIAWILGCTFGVTVGAAASAGAGAFAKKKYDEAKDKKKARAASKTSGAKEQELDSLNKDGEDLPKKEAV